MNRLVLPLSLALLAAGCSSTGRLPPSVPTADRAGQGWVVTRTRVAAQLVQACPGSPAESPEDLYAPSRGVVDRLEAGLEQLPGVAARGSDRQYVGVVLDGHRQVYVRGFPARDHRQEDPARSLVSDCEAGWDAVFDPQTGRFDGLRTFPVPATR